MQMFRMLTLVSEGEGKSFERDRTYSTLPVSQLNRRDATRGSCRECRPLGPKQVTLPRAKLKA